jgi:3-hydroxyacyl-[acyl-carrier-protein] dehydratase
MTQYKDITIAVDHPAYAGHFPNFPVLPGAVLLDEVLRAIAGERGGHLNVWQIASAKFLGAVRPGDALRVEFDAQTAGAISFSVLAAGRKVVSGVLNER